MVMTGGSIYHINYTITIESTITIITINIYKP